MSDDFDIQFDEAFNRIFKEESRARAEQDAADVKQEQDRQNQKDEEEDRKITAYTVLCAAEHGCPQSYIKHAAFLMGVDWPPPGKVECIRDVPERPF